MKKDVVLRTASQKGAACHQAVCRAIRLVSEDTDLCVINELKYALADLETSIGEIEDVLGSKVSVEECLLQCQGYLECIRRARTVLSGLDRFETGTLEDAESNAECAREHLKSIVSGYRCRDSDDR
jgi:hypothetical protein